MVDDPHDPEGEALDAEIAADRRAEGARRRRWMLYMPPIVSLAMAAAAIALSHPREVVGARAIVGGRPPAGRALAFRAIVLGGVPGGESPQPVVRFDVRVRGGTGRASPTDERGVSEVVVDPPLPPTIEVEGRGEGRRADDPWRPLASVDLASLAPPDPRDGVLAVRRTLGSGSGDLTIDVAPEKGALAPPIKGAAWIRVLRGGKAVAGARVEVTAEAGLEGDPPVTFTDPAGLVRVDLAPTSPPAIVHVMAERDGARGSWRGVLGEVLGVPVPAGDGFVPRDARSIELQATSSRRRAYWDLWREGTRLGGGAATFESAMGAAARPVAAVPLPDGDSAVYDLEVSTSPGPSTADDLLHAASWPIVTGTDPLDAWRSIASSPRFDDRVSPPAGSLVEYRALVAATIARAPVAVPRRSIVADGLAPALAREIARAKRVRRAATFAVVGGGLVELGLMLLLGVFQGGSAVDVELRALAGEAPPSRESGGESERARGARSAIALLVTGIGVVVLVFAGLAVMAWGMPG